MSTRELKVPDLGDFKDVPVIEVLVKPGDSLRAEQPVVVLESEKATMEVPATEAGTVKQLKVKVGDKVKCEISNLDTVDRRITATMKDIGSATPSVMPPREAAARGGTLGDLIKEKLGDKLDETIKR